MRLSSIHERIPENSQFSSCRCLCLAVLCALGRPRWSPTGKFRELGALEAPLTPGSHPRHSHPAHPSPLTLQLHLQDPPQNTQCSKQISRNPKLQTDPSVRYRSHRGPVSDGKTLGGLKTKINPTKNKWLYRQVTNLEAAGNSKPTDTHQAFLPRSLPGYPRAPKDKEQFRAFYVLKYCSDSQAPQAGLVVMLPEQKIPKNSLQPLL